MKRGEKTLVIDDDEKADSETETIIDCGDYVSDCEDNPQNSGQINFHIPVASKQLPSLHVIKQKAATAAWEAIRSPLLNACVEINSFPSNQLCTYCNTNEARFRCHQCGPYTYFCFDCLKQNHTKTSVLHSPEESKVHGSYHCM